MNERITVRRMTAEDIEQVLEVERACFNDPWSRDVFKATLLLPYAYYYVAEISPENGGLSHSSETGTTSWCPITFLFTYNYPISTYLFASLLPLSSPSSLTCAII